MEIYNVAEQLNRIKIHFHFQLVFLNVYQLWQFGVISIFSNGNHLGRQTLSLNIVSNTPYRTIGIRYRQQQFNVLTIKTMTNVSMARQISL